MFVCVFGMNRLVIDLLMILVVNVIDLESVGWVWMVCISVWILVFVFNVRMVLVSSFLVLMLIILVFSSFLVIGLISSLVKLFVCLLVSVCLDVV